MITHILSMTNPHHIHQVLAAAFRLHCAGREEAGAGCAALPGTPAAPLEGSAALEAEAASGLSGSIGGAGVGAVGLPAMRKSLVNQYKNLPRMIPKMAPQMGHKYPNK